jgi:hypothetical protein
MHQTKPKKTMQRMTICHAWVCMEVHRTGRGDVSIGRYAKIGMGELDLQLQFRPYGALRKKFCRMTAMKFQVTIFLRKRDL